MSFEYLTAQADRQESARVSQELAEQLETFLAGWLSRLDAWVDRRLVGTCVSLIAALIRFRSQAQGLLLSELGAEILSPDRAPAGTQRLHSLLSSRRWRAELVRDWLWEQAEKQVHAWQAKGETVGCIWDGSVWEKKESRQKPDLCPVRSSKGARIRKQRPGVFNLPGGRALVVNGLEWFALLVAGMNGTAVVATMRWWTRRGPHATTYTQELEHMLRGCVQRFGHDLWHICDRGFAGAPWVRLLLRYRQQFVIRYPKKYQLFDVQKGLSRKVWEIARGKRAWDTRMLWDVQLHAERQCSVLALPVRLTAGGFPLWLVVARRTGGKPWYLLTSQAVTTTEQAWRVVLAYSRRWQVEQTFRFTKCELAIEGLRVRQWEARQKFLLLLTLAYTFLLSLVTDPFQALRDWLLRVWNPRDDRRLAKAKLPLYRLRWAISRLWIAFPAVFACQQPVVLPAQAALPPLATGWLPTLRQSVGGLARLGRNLLSAGLSLALFALPCRS